MEFWLFFSKPKISSGKSKIVCLSLRNLCSKRVIKQPLNKINNIITTIIVMIDIITIWCGQNTIVK